VLGFTELLYTGKQPPAAPGIFSVYTVVGGIYLLMTLGSNALFRLAERRLRRGFAPV
jgi:polar amino acid transport system permease protein